MHATQGVATCVVPLAAGSAIAGSVRASGAPLTIKRPPESGRSKATIAAAAGASRPRVQRFPNLPLSQPRRRRMHWPPPSRIRLNSNSAVLPYLRMMVSLIEGVPFAVEELLALLRQGLRQHSIASRRRTDYVLCFLRQHPP